MPLLPFFCRLRCHRSDDEADQRYCGLDSASCSNAQSSVLCRVWAWKPITLSWIVAWHHLWVLIRWMVRMMEVLLCENMMDREKTRELIVHHSKELRKRQVASSCCFHLDSVNYLSMYAWDILNEGWSQAAGAYFYSQLKHLYFLSQIWHQIRIQPNLFSIKRWKFWPSEHN